MRGIGKATRKKQVSEYIRNDKLACVGLQETNKLDFSDSELREMAGVLDFTWKWIPASGLSGGIIIGVNNEVLELEDYKPGNFSISMVLRNRKSNFRWVQVTVYGLTNHDCSDFFFLRS